MSPRETRTHPHLSLARKWATCRRSQQRDGEQPSHGKELAGMHGQLEVIAPVFILFLSRPEIQI
jgi:hypothetical protein